MGCPFRPDEQEHAIDQCSRAELTTVEVRTEVAGTVGCRRSEYRIWAAHGQKAPRTWPRARQTPRTEEAESVPWTDGRPGKSHLGNPGEEEDSSCQESESKDAIRHGGLG